MPDVEVPDPHEVKEKAGDPFSRRIALFVAVYAVVLAIAATGGNNAGKDMLMSQMKAANAWSRYQTKVIREVLYAQEREQVEAELRTQGDRLPADVRQRREARLGLVRKKLDEYEAEKAEITAEAKEAERERDVAAARDPFFDFAEMVLQIAIVLASVAMLSGKRWAFLASLGLAAVGVVLTVNGYALIAGGVATAH